MAEWLFKEEPDHYSFADLEKDGETIWDGVTNALARIHLRKVKKGDVIWYYHTGKEKAIVGLAKAVSDAFSDPKSDDPKAVALKVKPVRRLKQPIPLERIKSEQLLASWELVRISRLSVMPVNPAQSRRLKALEREEG